MITLLKHPRLTVRRRSGTEGPNYDPYQYEETTIICGDRSLVFHEGLAVWLMVDGGDKRFFGYDEDYTIIVNTEVWMLTGYSLVEIMRFERRKLEHRWRYCPEGGRHTTTCMEGYPGETFYVCTKCNEVVDSSFDIGAII